MVFILESVCLTSHKWTNTSTNVIIKEESIVPCAEAKGRCKEVKYSEKFESFVIVGCQSILRELWWIAQSVYSSITLTVSTLYLKMLYDIEI